MTYSISHEGGDQGLIVSFSASGGRSGNCTILAAGPVPRGSSTAGVGLLPEEDFFVVNLSNSGGRLNVRNAPRASGDLLGTIANGTNRTTGAVARSRTVSSGAKRRPKGAE